MTTRAPAPTPLAIDLIESAPLTTDTVRLKLTGRWLDPAGAEQEELLVVQVQGRRHRFTASREPPSEDPEHWSASFTLPSWAEPRHDGQAALWLGSSVIPVPPPEPPRPPPEPSAPPPSPPEASAPPPSPREASAPPPPPPEPSAPPPPAEPGGPTRPESDTPRSGPLEDLLLRETVAALHAELEERTADAARVRGALADAQSELEARSSMQAALEATHGQLRVELERLTGGVERQRSELQGRIAELERERDEMRRQLASLTASRDESVAEIAALRDQAGGVRADAERRAAEATRLREELAAANVARDAARSEVAGLRTELERLGTELAATRERVGAEGGDLGQAQRLLADAKALADQLRSGGSSG